jgi:uncharacterized membrane protein YfcA
MRASLAFYFLLCHIAAFFLYAWAGLVDRDTIANVGMLAPGLMLGFGVATVIVGRMDERRFRYMAATVIVVGGSVLLVRELAGF